MRGPKADATRGVRSAVLKVRVLLALGHQSYVHDALMSIRHLSRKDPSRLNNLLQDVAIPSGFKNIKFHPSVEFLDVRGLHQFSMLPLFLQL